MPGSEHPPRVDCEQYDIYAMPWCENARIEGLVALGDGERTEGGDYQTTDIARPIWTAARGKPRVRNHAALATAV